MDIIDKITEKLTCKGKKSDIKKKLDILKIGDTYYDPHTQTKYECVGKLPNGESITISRSLGVEII